jgi:hypothetical protein
MHDLLGVRRTIGGDTGVHVVGPSPGEPRRSARFPRERTRRPPTSAAPTTSGAPRVLFIVFSSLPASSASAGSHVDRFRRAGGGLEVSRRGRRVEQAGERHRQPAAPASDAQRHTVGPTQRGVLSWSTPTCPRPPLRLDAREIDRGARHGAAAGPRSFRCLPQARPGGFQIRPRVARSSVTRQAPSRPPPGGVPRRARRGRGSTQVRRAGWRWAGGPRPAPGRTARRTGTPCLPPERLASCGGSASTLVGGLAAETGAASMWQAGQTDPAGRRARSSRRDQVGSDRDPREDKRTPETRAAAVTSRS